MAGSLFILRISIKKSNISVKLELNKLYTMSYVIIWEVMFFVVFCFCCSVYTHHYSKNSFSYPSRIYGTYFNSAKLTIELKIKDFYAC